MQELFDDILQYIRGVWLKRRYILIASWVLCPIGWALVTMLPNEYTSSAKVYADTRSILKPLLQGLTIQTDPARELELMVKTLLSRSNLEAIARDIHADVRAKNSKEYEAIINDLKSNIKIRSTQSGSARSQNLYTISYSGLEPGYAKDVVQAAVNVFVENTLGKQRLDTDHASQVITTQIEEYEARLGEAEQRLADFKREYRGYMPGSDNGYYAKLQQLKAQHEDAVLALRETETRSASARKQLRKEELRAAKQLSNLRTEYDTRIEVLQQRLDELLFRFTEKHPDVVETRRQIKELEALKEETLASYSSKDALINNVVYQDIKLTVSQLENEVASLKVRVDRYETKMSDLQEKLDKVPDVEVKLKALDRNYNITKSKHSQLLARRESARLSQSVGDSTEDIKFRIIEAPRVPSAPSGPMRPLLLSAVLLIGLGVGVGMSFLISQLSPVVSTTRQLYQLTSYPVFGVVSATERSGLATWEKRKALFFLLSNIVLGLVFATFMAVNIISSIQERVMQGFNIL